MEPAQVRHERRFDATWEGLISAETWVVQACEDLALKPETATALQVCFEELATNTVRYGRIMDQDGEPLWLSVEIVRQDEAVLLTMRDNSVPFDTKAATTDNKDTRSDGVRIGGLGLALIAKMAGDITHHTSSAGNETILTFWPQRNIDKLAARA